VNSIEIILLTLTLNFLIKGYFILMAKSFNDFIKKDVFFGDFRLRSRDAYDTYINIRFIFKKNKGGFFSSIKPMHINDLKNEYKILCPEMDLQFPGHIDNIFIREILTKLGFNVDASDMVNID